MSRTPRVAAAGLLGLVPGLGHAYLRVWPKAIGLGLATVVFVVQFTVWGAGALADLVTLGDVPMQHNSLFMLITGVLQLVICAVFAIVVVASVRDAVHTARRIRAGWLPERGWATTWRSLGHRGFPWLVVAPAYLLMVFAIVFPVVVTVFLAFTNYDFRHIPPARLLDWVGWENFGQIFLLTSYRSTFLQVFGWTVTWTAVATTLQIALGVFTAVVANQTFVRGKRGFGVIFLLPWAVPAFITIMSFSNMFNDSAGAINTQVLPLFNLLPGVEIGALPWKTDPLWTKVALLGIQGWLGFPYVFMLVTSILQSIPTDVLEAARIDGAGGWQRFRHITWPWILLVSAPVFITQYTGNFNNFSTIYLFHGGGPGSIGNGAGSTDILISWVYKITTGGSPQYSVAAAILLLISTVVVGVSILIFRRAQSLQMEA